MILRPVVRQMYDFDGDRISIVAGTIVVGGVNATDADTLQWHIVPLLPVLHTLGRICGAGAISVYGRDRVDLQRDLYRTWWLI